MSLCVYQVSDCVPAAPRLLEVRDMSNHPGQHPRAWCRAGTAWRGPAILGGPRMGKPCLQSGLSSGLSIERALRMGRLTRQHRPGLPELGEAKHQPPHF